MFIQLLLYSVFSFLLFYILFYPFLGKNVPKSESPKKKKMASGVNLSSELEDSITRLCYSQPEPRYFGAVAEETEGEVSLQNVSKPEVDEKCQFSFSQPVGTSDAFFLGSQLATTPTKNCPPVQRWVKRMTRFFVTTSMENTLKELTQVLDDLAYIWKVQTSPVLSVRILGSLLSIDSEKKIFSLQVTISSTDRRKNKLVFKASVIEMGSLRLLDFRLSRGDGLEFKRQFVRLKELLGRIEMSGPLTTWPLAMATNQFPK